jgi:hypothetical protein
MPRQETSHAAQVSRTGAGHLTDDQIGKLAELIADGRYAYPEDLGPEDNKRLQVQVRQRLREHLLRLIARAIARHLQRESRKPEDPNHVRPEV